ncbi:MAG: hypothetical protein Kow00109_01760 [Acidobacteriota bacterium]
MADSLGQLFRQELQFEAQTTRRVLERVPEDKWNWKPHPKSMSMGELASHIATIPEWVQAVIGQDEYDMGSEYRPWQAANRGELLTKFDRLVAEAAELLGGATDQSLAKPWSLKAGEHTIFTQPRAGVVRGMILSHLIHHRGQLSVYLRLNDIPVPSIYGPSADEEGQPTS